MFSRYCYIAVLISLSVSRFSAASDREWAEVRSPHFRVITDGSEKDARRVAREFEQIRFAMGEVYPKLRLEPGAPLLVICPRNEASMKALAPRFWKTKTFKPAGFFQQGWDKSYAVVRLDELSSESHEVVYHEYVHSVMHLNTRWLPLWLDEGLADFHATTRFEKSRIYIGAPGSRLRTVYSRPLIPLSTLLDVTQASPYYHDEAKAQMFYAQSWLLTHYLFFGPGMESGHKLLRFIVLLETTDQKKAFEQIFGDPKAVDKGLDQYLRTFTMAGGSLNSPANIDEKTFTARVMTAAETEAELGSYQIWAREPELARPLIEQALKDDPKLGLAHEDMGFLSFAAGKDEDAAREFAQAVHLDPKLYLSLFSLTMLSPAARSGVPADQESFRGAMLKVLEQNGQFAPALIQLARFYVRQGDLSHALGVARKAEMLEPTRAGYHVMNGQILLRMGHGAEAAGFASFVAARWEGPDHDEAVELWTNVPAAQRPAGEAPVFSPEAGTQKVEGHVRSVRCVQSNSDDRDGKYMVVISKDGHDLTFEPKGFFGLGYSDTLWWGRDHFDRCLHMEGLRAVVHYKPSSAPGLDGDLVRLDLRDDLPQAPAGNSEGKAAAEHQ